MWHVRLRIPSLPFLTGSRASAGPRIQFNDYNGAILRDCTVQNISLVLCLISMSVTVANPHLGGRFGHQKKLACCGHFFKKTLMMYAKQNEVTI